MMKLRLSFVVPYAQCLCMPEKMAENSQKKVTFTVDICNSLKNIGFLFCSKNKQFVSRVIKPALRGTFNRVIHSLIPRICGKPMMADG
ncbi:hypothetical protein [Bacterioplanoides sp. SCSIO 12839]|uniref:hypothetical protein n=1 Tax=Bacterioplanoides sp. SCSIO 12839 TaxID=2829569 RepID=UPI0021048F78|nr:hypothetical protein [Bacterioplanoides sp. SCSIO 12839]UTW47278.1 hypothetical protein KFF03_11865 [Bacterioplanoides sp. SCSIO 12839]